MTTHTRCQVCRTPLPDQQARAVLLDPGAPGDGTGGLFILMPYVLSMSAEAGPYCYPDAGELLDRLNRRGPWTTVMTHKELP